MLISLYDVIQGKNILINTDYISEVRIGWKIVDGDKTTLIVTMTNGREKTILGELDEFVSKTREG